MGAPHRDLPPGSQKWAEQVDALMDEVAELKALVRRLAQDARVDPSDPYKNMNVGDDVPAANSPVQTRITQHSDVKAYNVLDGQVLTWSQSDQAFTPVTPPGGGDFAPDPSVTQYTWEPSGYTMAHGTGELETSGTTGPYAWYGWTSDGQLDVESRSGGYTMGMFTVNSNGVLTLYSTSSATPGVRTRLEVNATGDAVDVKAGALGLPSCTTSGRPTSWTSGQARIVYDTTLGQLVIKFENGSWTPVGGGVTTFTPPGSTPFALAGTDPQAMGHNTGASGQYGFVATSDREVYLAANDPSNGDLNVMMQGNGVIIQADAPGTSTDWNMYSEIVTATSGITLRSVKGNGTGSGGTVTVACPWFILPTFGVSTRPSASGKQGAMYFDIGLNKPGFSDGTNWRDAAGTII